MSEQSDYPIICRERTRIRITTDVRSGNDTRSVVLSEACASWHDAGNKIDLIPDNASWISFHIRSVLSGRKKTLDFDLEEFHVRPNKATRIEVSARYLNEEECEISVKDKGFGEFFPASDKVLTRKINVAEYV